MKKLLLLLFAGMLLSDAGHAQSKAGASKLGLGLEVAIPTGDYKQVADYGKGFSLLYQKPVTERLSITGSAGYLRFSGPAVFNNIKYKEGYVPIKAGARYFIAPYIFGMAEIGLPISTANGSGSGIAFIYSPGLGTSIKVMRTGALDISVRYESWLRSNGTRSFGGIRAGYNF